MAHHHQTSTHDGQTRAGALLKIAGVVGLVVAGLVAMDYYDNRYVNPKRLENRYLALQQDIRTARADLFRALQECRAQGVEFGHRIGAACMEGMPAQRDIARTLIESAQRSMNELADKHCPNPTWCPGGDQRNPFDQFDPPRQ